MRVSFDLDDTLICYQTEVPREPCRKPYLLKPWFDEPLRQGAPTLMKELQRQGCDIWICTSSYRSPLLIRLWLAWYGVRVGRIITQDTYEAHLHPYPATYPPRKNPRIFG